VCDDGNYKTAGDICIPDDIVDQYPSNFDAKFEYRQTGELTE
jgi:hypothetical protein